MTVQQILRNKLSFPMPFLPQFSTNPMVLLKRFPTKLTSSSMYQLMYDSPFSPYCWSDLNMLVKQWYEWIDTLLAKCVSKRTTHRSNLAPWITPTISNLIKQLETAYQQKGTLHCTTLRLKNECDAAIIEDRVNYEEALADSRTPDKLFKFHISLRSNSIPSSIKYLSDTATDSAEPAELFNSFFCHSFQPTQWFYSHVSRQN